jgi:hypothetical protein
VGRSGLHPVGQRQDHLGCSSVKYLRLNVAPTHSVKAQTHQPTVQHYAHSNPSN